MKIISIFLLGTKNDGIVAAIRKCSDLQKMNYSNWPVFIEWCKFESVSDFLDKKWLLIAKKIIWVLSLSCKKIEKYFELSAAKGEVREY